MNNFYENEKYLGLTYSLCPKCLAKIPAQYVQRQGKVYLEKVCAKHGEFSALVWEEGADFATWHEDAATSPPAAPTKPAEKGCPYDCGICTQHAQAACCVLIEITQRCNQHCPYCFAHAQQSGGGADDYTLQEMDELFDFLRQQSGEKPFNIQLSGGEPTLHPQLEDIIRLCRKKGFTYVQLNTNGRKLAESPAYAKSLRKAGLHTVFLQFDGTRDDIYLALRGQPLLATKQQAIENSVAAGLGVVLVMTVVPGANDDNIGETLRFAAGRLPRVRGVHFQPVSYFGRFPHAPGDDARITLPGLIKRMVSQTNGSLRQEDFVPLASGHGRCSFHGNFLATPEAWQALSQKRPEGEHSIEKARDYLARRWSGVDASDDGENSCCAPPGTHKKTDAATEDSTAFDAAQWKEIAATLKRQTLAITAMAFQDVWTADLERLKRCRLHVATKDKQLIPFCAFNITDDQGRRLYEGVGRQ